MVRGAPARLGVLHSEVLPSSGHLFCPAPRKAHLPSSLLLCCPPFFSTVIWFLESCFQMADSQSLHPCMESLVCKQIPTALGVGELGTPPLLNVIWYHQDHIDRFRYSEISSFRSLVQGNHFGTLLIRCILSQVTETQFRTI